MVSPVSWIVFFIVIVTFSLIEANPLLPGLKKGYPPVILAGLGGIPLGLPGSFDGIPYQREADCLVADYGRVYPAPGYPAPGYPGLGYPVESYLGPAYPDLGFPGAYGYPGLGFPQNFPLVVDNNNELDSILPLLLVLLASGNF